MHTSATSASAWYSKVHCVYGALGLGCSSKEQLQKATDPTTTVGLLKVMLVHVEYHELQPLVIGSVD